MTSAARLIAQPDRLDSLLLTVYLIGIYLGVELHLSANVPVPGVISGVAGMAMLVKHMHRLQERQVCAILLVLLLFVGACLSASDYGYLHKRFTGLVQLTYSFAIGYAFYLVALLYDRRRLARIFLWLCLVILVGCALENYVPAFQNLSDTARSHIYDYGVYDADQRDLILYGRVRPKLFTSEPSAVTFGFTLFAFAWYVLSSWRWKALAYLAMFAAGFALMRGPTLMLGLLLAIPVEVLLEARRGGPGVISFDPLRLGAAAVGTVVVVIAGTYLSNTLYAERIADIRSGADPSFFSRVIAPPLVAFDVMDRYPIAGTGLTGEQLIQDLVEQVYDQSGDLAGNWQFDEAKHALTNYFWTHWIYLGIVWGGIVMVGLSLLLKTLEVPSITFCWLVWAVLGQASGAYVGPKTWTVLYLAAAVSVVFERERIGRTILESIQSRRLSWLGPVRPQALGPR